MEKIKKASEQIKKILEENNLTLIAVTEIVNNSIRQRVDLIALEEKSNIVIPEKIIK